MPEISSIITDIIAKKCRDSEEKLSQGVEFQRKIRYTSPMERQQYKPLDIYAFDMRLKVIRAGETVALPNNANENPEKKAIRGFHTHFTYEIFFATAGKMDLITREQTKTYERKVFIVPPKIHHFTDCDNDHCYSLLFSFEQQEKPSHRQWLVEERLKQGIFELPLSKDVSYYIRNLAEKSREPDAVQEQECALLANLIFLEVLGYLLPEQKYEKQKETGNSKHIFKLERHLNTHLSKKVTLQSVAEYMHLSTRQVERIVEREYGCTLAQLVADKKLASAERMLRNSQMSIDRIADEIALGGSYFYTLFKKRYGMTPLQYRKQHKSTQ